MPRRPDLVVSGINYGENVGTGVTISGTVGAALEAGALGIPGLAVSQEVDPRFHMSYSREVDFSAATHFTALFARLLLGNHLPADVDVLKVEVPSGATPQTPWRVTRLARQRYYEPEAPQRRSLQQPGNLTFRAVVRDEDLPQDSDIYTLLHQRMVSVTPLSLDLTARVDLKELEQLLRSHPEE
jgi:5'-nucleotidase